VNDLIKQATTQFVSDTVGASLGLTSMGTLGLWGLIDHHVAWLRCGKWDKYPLGIHLSLLRKEIIRVGSTDGGVG
jgi:hypothetical protein